MPAHLLDRLLPIYDEYLKLSRKYEDVDIIESDDFDYIVAQKCQITEHDLAERKRYILPSISFDDIDTDTCENQEILDALACNEEKIVAGIIRSMLPNKLNEVLRTLKPRQELVLRLRYSLYDGVEHSLEEVGTMLNVSRERIRQIEASAIRLLCRPKNAVQLIDYAGIDLDQFKQRLEEGFQ